MPIAVTLLIAGISSAQSPPRKSATYDDVAPIFAARCVMCHAGAKASADLSLDSYEGVVNGSLYSVVVKAGDAAGSELIRRIKGISPPRMPLNGPPFLTDAEIALIEGWVAGGLSKGAAAAGKAPAPDAPKAPAPGAPITYRHVSSILVARCAKCHMDNGLLGPAPEGFRLTSYVDTISSTERARVVPKHPDASELVRRIRGQARPRMPMDGPPYLGDEEIILIEDWIRQGACSEEGAATAVPVGARLRLHGTLDANGQLDGLALDRGTHTRVDKEPRPGDYVEVRGRLEESGGVRVERLRRR